MSETRLKGNPVNRRQGIVVRGILMGLVGKRPAPLDDVAELAGGKHRTTILRHLALLQERRRIGGYTTKGGMVRVWAEERE